MSDTTHVRERGDRGATATEYGLLVGFIAFVIIAGVTAFGGNLGSYFSGLGGWITAVI